MTLMTSACSTSASASAARRAPSARAIADEMPPPSDPAEIICISMTPGKTSAIPASASVPSRPTQNVSIRPELACASITMTLGHAMRSSSGTIGACSSALVRGSSADGGRTVASETTALAEVTSGSAYPSDLLYASHWVEAEPGALKSRSEPDERLRAREVGGRITSGAAAVLGDAAFEKPRPPRDQNVRSTDAVASVRVADVETASVRTDPDAARRRCVCEAAQQRDALVEIRQLVDDERRSAQVAVAERVPGTIHAPDTKVDPRVDCFEPKAHVDDALRDPARGQILLSKTARAVHVRSDDRNATRVGRGARSARRVRRMGVRQPARAGTY